MKKHSILLILCAILTVANYFMLDRQAGQAEKVRELQTERAALAGQVTELDRQVRELRASHEVYILVTEDIDKRLVRAEGRK